MQKPSPGVIRVWYITTGAQYLLGAWLLLLQSSSDTGRDAHVAGTLIQLKVLFVFASLLALISANSEHSIAGLLLAALAPCLILCC